jgi:hypothetical protein
MRNISQKTINKSEAVNNDIEQIRQGTRKILADLARLLQKILAQAFEA